MPRSAPAASRSVATWTHSSRVGTTTRARGVPSRWRGRERCSSGTPKPRVLPVPVRAWPMRSSPASASGSVSSWMANVRTIPARPRARDDRGRRRRARRRWGSPRSTGASALSGSAAGSSSASWPSDSVGCRSWRWSGVCLSRGSCARGGPAGSTAPARDGHRAWCRPGRSASEHDPRRHRTRESRRRRPHARVRSAGQDGAGRSATVRAPRDVAHDTGHPGRPRHRRPARRALGWSAVTEPERGRPARPPGGPRRPCVSSAPGAPPVDCSAPWRTAR